MQIFNKSEDLQKMRGACEAAASVLDFIEPHIQAGITTKQIEDLCRGYMDKIGVVSATIGYGEPPFTGYLCTSVNHVICHGIPNDKPLKKGDIINCDVTVIKDGCFGDTSRMFFVGEPSIQAKKLCEVTYEAMWRGIDVIKPGIKTGLIGHTIQKYAEQFGFSIVREYCGHGVGRVFHDDPQILHYGRPNDGDVIVEGMTFTVEPMINAGRRHSKLLRDQWTVVTADRSLSAQYEHTIIVTKDGYDVLTVSPNMPEPPDFVKFKR